MSYRMIYMLILVTAGVGWTQDIGGGCIAYDGREGACIGVRDCPSLLSLLLQITAGSGTQSKTDVLKGSICGPTSKMLVCCAGSQKESLLPEVCGHKKYGDRIVSGKDAYLGSWPWMVLLKGRSGNASSWFCGGSLISDRYVLTAAHCFSKDRQIELEFARIGEYNLAQNPDCSGDSCAPPHQDIAVERIIIHHSYGSACKECNDIALLRLSRAATLDKEAFVMPICLPIHVAPDEGSPIQFLPWAAGWGSTNPDRSVHRTPDILQEVEMPIVDNAFCRYLKTNYSDPSMVFCAGGEGRDTCRGDSGGPLTLPSRKDDTHSLIGITSLGPRTCGTRHTLGLYTSVQHYLSWILGSMRP